MFKHLGDKRTIAHNLKIASQLSFVAGLVNVVGFLAVQRLTTNVTGHFVFFIDEVFKLNFAQGIAYFFYIFSFLAGAFFSNFLIEVISRKSGRYQYVIPASIECVILFIVGLAGRAFVSDNPDLIAFILLFAMGLQNALVTTISNANVRTTHLTGLFTDLGIDLSQLFFYTLPEQRKKLFLSIQLRAIIIIFFFIGGLAGGIFYTGMGSHILLLGAAVLAFALIYDTFIDAPEKAQTGP